MKLHVFVPCEKVILDANNVATLIALMGEVGVQVPTAEPPPRDAVNPQPWAIFTMWENTPEEFDRTFVQTTRIYWPDGKEFVKGDLTFLVKRGGRFSNNTVNIIGMPIGQEGSLRIEMWLELNGKKVTDTYTFTLGIRHNLGVAQIPPQSVAK